MSSTNKEIDAKIGVQAEENKTSLDWDWMANSSHAQEDGMLQRADKDVRSDDL